MSTHGNIKAVGVIDFTPNFIDDDIQFEINMPEFVWARSKDEALNYLDDIIQSAKKAKKVINNKDNYDQSTTKTVRKRK